MFEIINNPLFIYILVLVASLYVLVRAADYIVLGISSYARKFRISEYLVGFIIVAAGMSTPEFVSALMGSLQGESGIVVGTFFGSAICSLLLILGIAAVIGKKISLESRLLRETRHYILVLALLPIIFLLFGGIPRWGGAVLILCFSLYVVYLWRKEGTFGKLKRDVKIKRIWKDVFIFLGALIALLLAARWMVFSAVQISDMLGISIYLIALIVIGIGASLPDLTVQIRAIKSGHTHIAFGDILGSILMGMLLFLGIVAIINPVVISLSSILLSIIFYVIGLLFVLWLVKHRKVNYGHGIMMLALYALFIVLSILSEIGLI